MIQITYLTHSMKTLPRLFVASEPVEGMREVLKGKLPASLLQNPYVGVYEPQFKFLKGGYIGDYLGD